MDDRDGERARLDEITSIRNTSHSHLSHMLISTQVHTPDWSGEHSYTHLFEQRKTCSA